MTTQRKLLRGAASAALVVGLGLSAAPTLAFDTTNWTWTLTRTDTGMSNTSSSLTALPTGDMAVQARQIYLGDVHAEADSQGTVLPAASPLASTDLGHVDASASAYANVYTAASEVPLSVDVGQYHMGAVAPTSGATPSLVDPTAANANYAYADAMIADAGTGFFTPHQTTASATAVNVTDATASTNARAVSNTASLELASTPPELAGADPTGGYVTNALMSADLTQLSHGLTDARATTAVTLNSAGSLGGLDRSIASASATAIGNLGTATTRVGTLPPAL